MTLGEELLDRVLEKEDFVRAPGQKYTDRDGNCGVSAILHLLQMQQPEDYLDLDVTMFRKLIVHQFKQQVKQGILFVDLDIQDWAAEMTKPGVFVDHIWLQACANYVARDIILMPTFSQSCIEIGRIIRIGSSNQNGLEPLFLGYMEDNLYTSGHFQAIVPLPGQNPVLQYVKTGDLAANLRLPEASNIFEDFPNRAVPLRNFRNRIFTNTDASIGELQSTKRPREEEDNLTSSKRTKLDTMSLKSVCHVCHFKLRKNNVKKRCFCKKLVHHSCFLADGSMCK